MGVPVDLEIVDYKFNSFGSNLMVNHRTVQVLKNENWYYVKSPNPNMPIPTRQITTRQTDERLNLQMHNSSNLT